MKTNEEVAKERFAVIEETRTWINTPFHHNAWIKGAGVDCVNIGVVYEPVLNIKFEKCIYSPQWHLHVNENEEIEEKYINYLLSHGFVEITQEEIQPADVVVSKLGRVFCHGAIIVDWPKVIQAESAPRGAGKVIEVDATANCFLANRKLRFFTRQEWR